MVLIWLLMLCCNKYTHCFLHINNNNNIKHNLNFRNIVSNDALDIEYSQKCKNQCLISIKDNNIYCNEEVELYLNNNNILSDKKLITISPGGFKGFYLLGVLTYIKETYDMNNYIYSGASAGAWNSLFMCYKGEPLNFVYSLLDYNIKKTRSIIELQYYMKYKLLSKFKDEDFELEKIFIGVTTFKYLKPITNIFSNFTDLDDAINCCMASSHIPFITGGITNRYNNIYAFDGGFSSYPYLNKKYSVLHVSPSMWDKIDSKNNEKTLKTIVKPFKKYSEFFSLSKNNLLELFDNGYQDAKQHKEYLDTIFINNNTTQTNKTVI